MPHKALHDSAPLPPTPSFLLFSTSAPITLVSWLFLKHATHVPTFGPLHWLSLCLENSLSGQPHGSSPCFLQIAAQMLSSQRMLTHFLSTNITICYITILFDSCLSLPNVNFLGARTLLYPLLHSLALRMKPGT